MAKNRLRINAKTASSVQLLWKASGTSPIKRKFSEKPTIIQKSRENPDRIREKGSSGTFRMQEPRRSREKLMNQRRLMVGFEGNKGIERGKESKADLGQKDQPGLEQLGD